ncbi:MAG: putative ABC exporter domain-containing protein [Oscillospiraceae bacterium]|jgi:hypothetical protein|nr:putative ABC exporter domain-containing protein [Oscillospiraceae bacterium]
MKAILFLAAKTIKNLILDLVHHPARLISFLVIAVVVLGGAFSTADINTEDIAGAVGQSGTTLDIGFLHGIFMALLLIIGVPVFLHGLSSGTTLFSMSEVNFLFVSPVSQKKILVYGITKQMGATLLFFLVFLVYGNMAVSFFDISVTDGLILLFSLALYIFFCQLMSLVFYCISNGRDNIIRIIKAIVFICAAVFPVYCLYQIYQTGWSFDTAAAVLKTPMLEYIPVFGWFKGAVFGLINADYLRFGVFLGLLAATVAVSIAYFLKSNPDYYEDVLQNTETTYEMRQAIKKEGGFSTKNDPWAKKKIRVSSTGLGGGFGASAFFFKQFREIRRRSFIPFVDLYTIILAIAIPLMAYVMQAGGGHDIDSSQQEMRLVAIIMAIAMGVYMSFIFAQVGDWNREFMKAPLFLVPEKPYAKLFFASLTSICKSAVEGTLAYGIFAVVMGLNLFEAIVCILFYVSFGFIFTSVGILSSRFIGDINNKMMNIMIYSIAMLVVCAPGAAATAGMAVLHFTGSAFVPSGFMALIPMIIWNIGAGLLINVLSKETLHNMEVKI